MKDVVYLTEDDRAILKDMEKQISKLLTKENWDRFTCYDSDSKKGILP